MIKKVAPDGQPSVCRISQVFSFYKACARHTKNAATLSTLN